MVRKEETVPTHHEFQTFTELQVPTSITLKNTFKYVVVFWAQSQVDRFLSFQWVWSEIGLAALRCHSAPWKGWGRG